MSIYGQPETKGIWMAKDINQAICAYNHECDTCLRHGCKGEFCAATKALAKKAWLLEAKMTEAERQEVAKVLA